MWVVQVGEAERGVKDVGEGIVDAVGGAIGWAARKVSLSFPGRTAE